MVLTYELRYAFQISLQLTLVTQSFYTLYRNLFSRLAHEESLFDESLQSADLPSFGDSSWSWTAVSKAEAEIAARTFYNYWLHFSTAKDFAWKDQWDLAEAPDRRIRRYYQTLRNEG